MNALYNVDYSICPDIIQQINKIWLFFPCLLCICNSFERCISLNMPNLCNLLYFTLFALVIVRTIG